MKTKIVVHPKIGKRYHLAWAKPNCSWILKSYDNSGTCIMKASLKTKNNFTAKLTDLREKE